VRDICADANANQAAVNYHFGSKEKLYLEVWKVAAEQMQADATMPRMTEGADPEAVLRAFIAWFMALVMVKCDEDRWTGDLLAHETANPTPAAMSIFVERCCRPVSDELHRIVGARLGPSTRSTRRRSTPPSTTTCRQARNPSPDWRSASPTSPSSVCAASRSGSSPGSTESDRTPFRGCRKPVGSPKDGR
jgi:AcrR family transcriptional regulator